MKQLLTVAIAVACALLLAPQVNGQAVAVAEIHGQVLDTSGAAVPGATVRVIQTDTQLTRATNSDVDGSYSLPNLPIGPYRFEVTGTGFKTYVQSGILLQVGNNVQVNTILQLGSISENIEVTAGGAMVETKENSVNQVIDQRRIIDLPLNGRQATQLVLLSGGATNAPTSGNDNVGSKSFYSSVVISVAGSQGNTLNYLLDGGDNVDRFSNVNMPFPFPDALQEFSVETNALPARNGLLPGGVVNIVTKSGTNQWHGDLFEFLRNGNVNARNYFAKTHDLLKRNQFGGTFGGRIIRDKVFFFGGYQGTRQRTNPPSSTSFVLTPDALRGDFSTLESAQCQTSKIAKTLFDPATGQPFTNNQIPTTRFDPAAVKLSSYLPVPSDPCGRVTYGIQGTGDDDQVIGRIDGIKGQRHMIYGRYFLVDYGNPAVWDPKNILVTTTRPGLSQRAQSFTFGETFTISPNTVNSFHATFTRRRNNRSSDPNLIGPADLGISSPNLSTYIPNYVQVQTTAGFQIAGCQTCTPAHFNVNTFQFADDVDIMRGRHQLAFGVDVVRTQTNTNAGYKENGSFFVSGGATTDPLAKIASGDPLADLMLGALSEFDQSRPQQTSYRQTILGFYGQDTFRLNNRITLNAGLRWEPMLYPSEYFGRGTTFSMADFLAGKKSSVYPNAPAGMMYFGDPGVNKGFTSNKLANFSPRFGVVWNPHGDGRDSVRAGAALLYNTPETWFSQRLASNPPVVNEIDLTGTSVGTFSNPWKNYAGGNPFPGVVPAPKDVIFPTNTLWVVLGSNMKPMYMTEWNLSYQHQFAKDWMASASYIGNKTTHMWLGYDANAAVPVAGVPLSDVTHRRPLYLARPQDGQYIGNLLVVDDGANATYNGLLLSVQHRFSRGFTLLSNYTWSHCISDGDSVGNIRQSYYQIQNDRRADRGDCNYDIRHIFNTSFVVQSPVVGKGIAGRLLGNWQLSPILRAASGMALNVTTGKDNSGTGPASLYFTDRPNQLLANPYNSQWGPGLLYLNPAAFTPNAPGTFGNVGRDTVRALTQVNFDLALSRTFAFTEVFKLEARGEAFNAINHTNFNPPNTTATNANFGKILSSADPRILQFALKLRF